MTFSKLIQYYKTEREREAHRHTDTQREGGEGREGHSCIYYVIKRNIARGTGVASAGIIPHTAPQF